MRNAARLIGLTAMAAMLATSVACRDTSNPGDDMIDGGHGGDGGTIDAGPGGNTIYALQNPATAEGTAFTLEGVEVTAVDSYGGRVGGIYVQEVAGGPFSGVFVYNPQGAGTLHVGDIVTITGGVKTEFALATDTSGNKLTELAPPQGGTITVAKTGTGTPLQPTVVDPVLLASNLDEAEKWEGVLIKIENVAVVSTPRVLGMTDPTLKAMNVTGPFQVESSLVDLSVGGTAIAKGDCFTSITGIGDYFFNYMILPRSEADYGTAGTACPAPEHDAAVCGDTIDNDHNGFADCQDLNCQGVAGVNCTVTGTVTNVQNGTIAANTPVKLTNVVVTAVAKFKTAGSTVEEHRIWVADSATAAEFNGVLVFKATVSGTNGATIDNLVPGDVVTVNGVTTEYFTETEIVGNASIPVTVERTGTGPAPTPIVVPMGTLLSATTAEKYEGVLVTIQNQKVVSLNPDMGGSPPDVGEWSIGTAGAALRIDDVMFKRPMNLAIDQCFTVSGPVDFTFSNYKLQPRGMADVAAGTCP